MLHAAGMLTLYTAAVLSTTANATIRMVQKEAPITINIVNFTHNNNNFYYASGILIICAIVL